MNQLQFVFSDRFKWKLSRHFSFWLCWYVFQVYLYSFTPSPMLTKLSFWLRIQMNAGESLIYLIPNLFLSYALMYFVIPKMIIPAKYLTAILTVIVLMILTGGLSALVSLTIIEYMRQDYLVHHRNLIIGAIPKTPFQIQLFLAWVSGLRGSITIGGLAAAIKLMKHFYEKQQHAMLLEQEKTVAELQTLKAQLHPHFLFNTLNNIYSHTQDTAPVAAEMVLGLSTLLRYILYTCDADFVPLEKEVNMMLEYIELEKKRYGNKLEIVMNLPSDYHNLQIAPLLILPFVENCFKHGTSEVLERPWINIHFSLDKHQMHVKMINGKANNNKNSDGGIGIENVKKRLSLLYPDQYQLSVLAEEEVFIVNLTITLTAAATVMEPNLKNHEFNNI